MHAVWFLVVTAFFVTPTSSTESRAGPVYPESRRKPATPRNLRVLHVSTRFITLAWDMPDTPGQDSEKLTFMVTWKELDSNRKRKVNTTNLGLTLQSLRPRTEYEVRVQSLNSQGPSEQEAVIQIRTETEVLVPSEPLRLMANAISPTEITVKWEPPQETNGVISSYELYYYKKGAKEQKKKTNKTFLKLRELDEYSKYSFRVAAVNAKGVGSSTSEVVARTFSDRPSEPPQNFTLEVSSSTSVIVRWLPPPLSAQNGLITGYKIRQRLRGDKHSGQTKPTSGDRTNYALTGLKKGTEYQVRICAQTVNGTGPFTAWMTATTFKEEFREDRAPDQPSTMAANVKANSIEVNWGAPNSDIRVRQYILGYGRNITDVYKKTFTSQQRRYVISNLSPGTLYILNIQAKNNKGVSPQKLMAVTTLLKDEEPMTPMNPPLGINTKVLGHSSVQVTWTDGSLNANQIVTDNRYYLVHYRPQHQRRKKWRSVQVRRVNAVIKDLRPYTTYEFCVKIVNEDRESDWSMMATATTDEKDCPAGNYGKNCAHRCSVHCSGPLHACDHVDGSCDKGCRPGYVPPLCINECPVGKYGLECAHICSGHCAGPTNACDHKDGSCDQGCDAGYKGQLCTEECPEGKYGLKCSNTCSAHCFGSNNGCDHVDGSCDQGCDAGYNGSLCSEACPDNMYGLNCSNECSDHCAGPTNGCDHVNGSCDEGCDPGYMGPLCSEECDLGLYGEECSEKCNEKCAGKGNPCDLENGTCELGCDAGYQGAACTMKVSKGGITTGTIVAVAVAVAGAVSAVAVAIGVHVWRSGTESQHNRLTKPV